MIKYKKKKYNADQEIEFQVLRIGSFQNEIRKLSAQKILIDKQIELFEDKIKTSKANLDSAESIKISK